MLRGAIIGDAKVTPNFRANQHYYASWPTSVPHERIEWKAEAIRKGEWVRISYCLQGAQPTSVMEMTSIATQGGNNIQVATPPDQQTLKNVAGAAEMESTNDGLV